MIDVDLAAFLANLTSAPVQQNYSSVDKVQPRVWYQHSSGEDDLLLQGSSTSLKEDVYTVEVNALDPDAGGTIAQAIAQALNGFRGAMGSTTVLGAFVSDAADDYQPRGLDLDDGYHVFAFQVRILS